MKNTCKCESGCSYGNQFGAKDTNFAYYNDGYCILFSDSHLHVVFIEKSDSFTTLIYKFLDANLLIIVSNYGGLISISHFPLILLFVLVICRISHF